MRGAMPGVCAPASSARSANTLPAHTETVMSAAMPSPKSIFFMFLSVGCPSSDRMSVIRYLHYIYDFSDLWLLESRGYGNISYEAGKRSEERRVGKECRSRRSTCDWSSDVCSSDLGCRSSVICIISTIFPSFGYLKAGGTGIYRMRRG